jgi:hypothetical protein
MKQFRIVIVFFCSILLLSVSCQKEGQGPQGERGEQGVPGPDGSKILSGNGAAAANIGAIGDFYIDLSTSQFYGPKTTNGWGTPITLRGATGATGATGAAGSKIHSGTGAPAASLGSNGDYYLDKSNYNFYGPKTAGAWGAALSLRGPAGPQGPAGTANVIYSTWKYATNFNDSTIDNSKIKVGYVAAPSLTSTILNSGMVMVYFTYGAGNFTLPYTSNAGSKVNTISYTPMLNKILITRFAHDNSNSVSLSTLLQYRYILIPGGVSGGRLATPVDYSDYSAVCRYYGIPE